MQIMNMRMNEKHRMHQGLIRIMNTLQERKSEYAILWSHKNLVALLHLIQFTLILICIIIYLSL